MDLHAVNNRWNRPTPADHDPGNVSTVAERRLAKTPEKQQESVSSEFDD